jgi:hypothetical protein
VKKMLLPVLALLLMFFVFFFFSRKFVIELFGEYPMLTFSSPGGFYSDPISLSIEASQKDLVIRYTLDGSNPNITSSVYDSPLIISESTVATIQAFRKDKAVGKKYILTYILGRKTDLPIVAISTDPANLWDPVIGIYTLGYDTNYKQHGMAWERPAHLQFFEPDGRFGFELDLGLRIHGGATRMNAQKGLRIIPREIYGQNIIRYPLFPELEFKEFRRLLIRSSGNDLKFTMMRDALMQSLVSDLNLDTQAYRPAVLYLNGKYWGIQNIREYYDLRYFKNHYGVKDNTIAVIEPMRVNDGYPEVVEGLPGDELHYMEMLDFVTQHDMSKKKNYEHVKTLIDIENFIDYYTTQIYFNNDDWLDHNIKMWRFKTDSYQPEARYGLDGRWRWLLYDVDNGFIKLDYNALKKATAEYRGFATILMINLLKNDSFKTDFINRCADLLNSVFLPEVVISKIDTMQAGIANEIPFHIARWLDSADEKNRSPFSSVEEWESNIQVLRDFATNRPEILRQQYVEYFSLPRDVYINISAEPFEAGSVLINKLEVKDFPKETIYFKGVAIPLKAKPAFGYKFSHWETTTTLQNSTENKVNYIMPLDNFVDIKAVFEPTITRKVLDTLKGEK